MNKFLIKYFINPFIWRYLKGSKRYAYLKKFRELEKNSIEENVEIQRKKLFDLIRHAHKNIPYYKKIIDNKKIKYSSKTIFEDIKKFPILTKKIIRENFEDLQDKKLINNAWKNTSGGSTGEPVIFYQDMRYSDPSAAFSILCYEWARRDEGDYMIKLWGDEREILKDAKGLNWFLIRHLKNIEILNSFKMSQEDIKKHINIINKKKPKIIESYVQSIYELAKFIQENKLQIYSPKGIITSAGTLYPNMQKIIESVFRCKVYNRYGSREAGDMACSCEKDEGLHINIYNHYFEILDKNLKDTKSKNYGKVHITILNNYVMPLIRYDIGDIAVPKETKKQRCSCGRGFPLINKIEGRVGSMIKTKKGIIDSTALTTSFYYYDSIKKYKFIQKTKNEIIIKIVLKNKKQWEKDKQNIINKLEKILGDDIKIKFEIVKDIPPLKSGKYQYIVSKVKN